MFVFSFQVWVKFGTGYGDFDCLFGVIIFCHNMMERSRIVCARFNGAMDGTDV